jgi:hypothetical protein
VLLVVGRLKATGCETPAKRWQACLEASAGWWTGMPSGPGLRALSAPALPSRSRPTTGPSVVSPGLTPDGRTELRLGPWN